MGDQETRQLNALTAQEPPSSSLASAEDQAGSLLAGVQRDVKGVCLREAVHF